MILCSLLIKEQYYILYVIVMGIIKCEKVYAGILIFSSLFDKYLYKHIV